MQICLFPYICALSLILFGEIRFGFISSVIVKGMAEQHKNHLNWSVVKAILARCIQAFSMVDPLPALKVQLPNVRAGNHVLPLTQAQSSTFCTQASVASPLELGLFVLLATEYSLELRREMLPYCIVL